VLTAKRWLLVAVLLLGFGLRLVRLGAGSLWYDETVSVHLAGKAPAALVAHTAGDIHPPGYYLLLHGWLGLAGAAEAPAATVDFLAAFLSLFFGLLLVALAYRLALAVFGPPAGLLAAFLVAISPYNLWYSQEVRMYTLAAALGTGLIYVVLRLLRPRPGRGPGASPWFWLGLYVLLGALGLWSLYYFAFLLLALNLMAGGWWLARRVSHRQGATSQPAGANPRGRPVGQVQDLPLPRTMGISDGSVAWLGRWALAQAGVLLLYSPWLPVALRQATDPPVPPWRSFTGLGQVLVESWTALSLGQSVMPTTGWPPLWVWPVLLLFAILFVLGLATRRRPAEPLLLAGCVVLPVALIYTASLLTPLYHVRYVFPYSTPFYVIVAGGLALLARRWRAWGRAPAWRSLAAGLALTIIVVSSGASVYAYHTDPAYAADDHAAAVTFLAERWRPGDAILVDAGYVYPAVLHYWDGPPITWRGRLVGDGPVDFAAQAGQGPVLVLAGSVDGDPGLGWGDPDSDFYAMSRAETAQALESLFAAYHRVWVYRIYDTVTDPEGFIRQWLAEHGTPFEDQVFGGESQLRVQGFVTGRDPLAGMGAHYDAALADGSLALLAGDLAGAPLARVEVGQALDLALAWRVGQVPPAEAILFAGLFDEAGGRWAQTDERPLGSLYPVAAWPSGGTVRTPLRLHVPVGTPPGTYRLELGWYRFQDGQPLWLPWTRGDRLLLGQVDVVSPGGGWDALPAPAPAYAAGVTVGPGVRLLGFDAPLLSLPPGGMLALDLYWQALADGPAMAAAVLQLADGEGRMVVEVAGPPAGGLAPFAGLFAGQVVRDPRQVPLPADLAPGVYTLSLGRRAADGAWLPVRRGVFSLGETYPLATVYVREEN